MAPRTRAVPELAQACSLLEEAAQCSDADEDAAEDLFGTWEQQAAGWKTRRRWNCWGAFRSAMGPDGGDQPPVPDVKETVYRRRWLSSRWLSRKEPEIPMPAVSHAGPVTARDIEEWIAADNLAALVDQYPLLSSISLKRRVIDWAVPVAKEGRPAPLLEIGAMEESPALVKHLNALIDAAPPEEIGRFIEIDGMPKTQKRMAAVILGSCKTPAAEGMLVRLLRDASPLVRMAAALGLGWVVKARWPP